MASKNSVFPDAPAHSISGTAKICPGHIVLKTYEAHLSLAAGFRVGFFCLSLATDVIKHLIKM